MSKSHLKCPSCHVMFGFENTPKILKNCQHTICINCLKTLKNCPIDSAEINSNKWGIKSFLTNTEILQEIQKQDAPILTKKYDRRFTFGNKQNRNQFYCEKAQKLSSWKICNKHLQKANFICKNDAKMICGSCISADDHIKCDIIEYDELTQIMTNFTDQTYKIFDKIKQKSQNLNKAKLNEFIENQINQKKNKETYKIKSFFQKLFQKLRKQQKEFLQNLENQRKQSIQSLKEAINLRESEIKNQNFRIQVHKLTTVMSQVYEYEGMQNALLYLNQSCEESKLIEKGKKLFENLSQIEQKMKKKIKQTEKKLQCSLDEKIIEGVEKIIYDLEPIDNPIQSKTLKTLNFVPAFCLTIFQSQKPKHEISSLPLHTENGSQSLSQSIQEDFLLESMNDIQQNQAQTKTQITFQEHFSMIVPDALQEEQFTPILRKQQDSLTVNDETTLKNIQNLQKSHFPKTQSAELTVIQNKCRQNSLIENFMRSQTTQLQKTQIKNRSRSPLTPLRNGSSLKFKKNEIPEKYLTIWQAAKQDSSPLIDLTGAELGDTLILHLGSFLSKSKKIRSLKLIRNKLTDEIIYDLINCINQTNIISLNLSQNMLTQKSLEILENINLGNLKSVTLSQNKIVLRKVKDRIQKFKQKGIILTV